MSVALISSLSSSAFVPKHTALFMFIIDSAIWFVRLMFVALCVPLYVCVEDHFVWRFKHTEPSALDVNITILYYCVQHNENDTLRESEMLQLRFHLHPANRFSLFFFLHSSRLHRWHIGNAKLICGYSNIILSLYGQLSYAIDSINFSETSLNICGCVMFVLHTQCTRCVWKEFDRSSFRRIKFIESLLHNINARKERR